MSSLGEDLRSLGDFGSLERVTTTVVTTDFDKGILARSNFCNFKTFMGKKLI
jgi:hypothetical protein